MPIIKRSYKMRAQALAETGLLLPFFVFVFYGLIWGIRTTIMAERSQIAVRNSGLLLSRSDPYSNYSLYNMYNNAGATLKVKQTTCTPSSSAVLGGNSVSSGKMMPFFFQSNVLSSFTCDPLNSVIGMSTADSTFSHAQQAYIFIRNQTSVQSLVPTQSNLNSTLGAQTGTSASGNFLRESDIGNLMHCFPELDAAILQSLDITNDATPGNVIAPALTATSLAPYTVPLVPASTCAPQVTAAPAPLF